MTNYEFATWVRGFLQLCPEVVLDKKKIQILKNHLNLVAAIEGNLGEKNQTLYNKILEFQKTSVATTEAEYSLKQFLHENYFDKVA